MKKFFAFLLMMSCSIYVLAAEIDIATDKTDLITQNDIDAITKLIASRHMRVTSKNAVKILKENKILANAFLKEKLLTAETKADINVLLNEKLANLMVDNSLEKKPLSDEVLLSYYKDNLVDYYQNKKITFSVYSFDDFNSSLDFYTKYKDKVKSIKNTEANMSQESQTLLLRNLHPDLVNLLLDNNTTGYITPPQKFYKKYIILHVKDFIDAGIEKFEAVKDDVKKIVQKKIRYDTKKALLNKYKKSEKL